MQRNGEHSSTRICDDGIDNDRDGFVDFADPTCDPGWPYWEAVSRCGLGAELVLALAPLAWLRRRRMRIRLR